MATYTVQSPDGRVVTLSGPEGASQEEVIAQAQKLLSSQPAEQTTPTFTGGEEYGVTPDMITQARPISEDIVRGGAGMSGFARGSLYDPIAALAQFGSPEARKAFTEEEAKYQQARAARGETGIELSRLGGNILSPINIVPGVGAARGVAAVGGGLTRQAAGAGAVTALLNPVSNSPEDLASFLAEKVEQAGAGTVLGVLTQGGVNAAGKVGTFLKDLSSPLTKKGRENILREELNKLAGPERDKVLQALSNAPELVPGSAPTAAQAVADIPTATGIASFEQRLSKVKEISPIFAERTAQQEAAREALIQNIAKTPEQLELAKIARSVDADRNYGLAFTQTITADPALAKLAQNPYFREALPDAIKLAESKGISAKTDLTEFLQGAKMSLDKQLRRTGDAALDSTEKREVARVKSELVKWLGKKNPQYEQARAAFSQASEPINVMEVGQYLLNKLKSPMDTERAGVFGLAVRDAATTLKRSTGDPRFEKLSQVVSKQQEKDINSVLADLQRAQKANELGKKTSIGSMNVDNTPELPNLLSRPAAVVNALLRSIKGDAVEEINKRAGELLSDPQALSVFMSTVPKSKIKSVVDAMYFRLSPENRSALNRVLGIETVQAFNRAGENESIRIRMETGAGAQQ